MTARDDAAGLRERVEALADEWERDADEHLSAWGQHLPCSVSSMAEMLRALLAESTPAPAPAADGGEVEALAEILRAHGSKIGPISGSWTCPPPCDARSRNGNLHDGDLTSHAEREEQRIAHIADMLAPLLADIRRTARAEGAREALEAAARELPGFDAIRTHGDAAKWLRARATSGPQ